MKDALQTAPGVHLRQNGGAGSDFNLNLNGLQGKAVRVFVDGSLSKSTGNVLNVDGGVAMAFVR